MDELKIKQSIFTVNFINSCAAAIFAIDLDHRVILWNESCERLTGIAATEVLGTKNHWMAFFDHPEPCLSDAILDGRVEELSERYASYKKSHVLKEGILAEAWVDGLGGEKRCYAIDCSPLFDDNHQICGAVETLMDVTKLKRLEKEKNTLIAELQQAVGSIKTLRGLLPICAACKKIRDDKGYWNKLENYIEAHSDVEFKHGLCPACEESFYLTGYKKKLDED